MRSLFGLLFFSMLSVSFAQGQTRYQISGSIVDEKGEAIDLAIVALFNHVDSSFVKSEFSERDGAFLFATIPAGKYRFHAEQDGFVDLDTVIDVNQNLDLGAIRLKVDGQQLEEVTVGAKTPFVVRKIDRTVITPDALIANAGSNALEVLERAPGITIDQNGVIILKGRAGVAVYINDKPSYLSGSDLANYLRSLPAGSIKDIEIIENPPAKYEAAGNAGIVNINIKRGTVKGLYGNTSVSYRRSRYNSSNNSLNLNYNKNKVSLYTNVYGGFWENFQDLNINRYYLNLDQTVQSSFEQNSFNNRNGKYLDGKIGIDLYPNEKTNFGFAYKGSSSPGLNDIDNTALVSNASGNLLRRVVADNLSETTFSSNLINGYFSRSIDTVGGKLSFDADFVQYRSSNDQVFKNYQYSSSGQLVYNDQINGEIPSEINIFALKADVSKSIKEKSKIEAGLKSAFTRTDNEAIYSNTIGGVMTPDYNLSNRFLYDELIHAAYVNFNTEIGKIGLQFGLRAEATRLQGNQLGNAQSQDTSFTRNYASLFPTFYAFTKLDSAGIHSMNLSYGRRIDRPYFEDLNPFISPLDKFTFYTGNPNLLPTYSNNLSLTYSYNNMLNATVAYSITSDEIRETLEIVDSIYFSRPGNIASSQYLSLGIDGSFPITKWYNLNAYAEVALVRFDSKLYTEQLNSRGTNVFVSATNSFTLGKGWRIDVSGRYLNDHVSSQLIIKGYALLDAGVQKKIMKGKGSLKVSASDLFYSRIGSGIINNLKQTNADWNSKFDSRSITISFQMSFGKSTFNKEKYNSSGSESEQQRVRG